MSSDYKKVAARWMRVSYIPILSDCKMKFLFFFKLTPICWCVCVYTVLCVRTN